MQSDYEIELAVRTALEDDPRRYRPREKLVDTAELDTGVDHRAGEEPLRLLVEVTERDPATAAGIRHDTQVDAVVATGCWPERGIGLRAGVDEQAIVECKLPAHTRTPVTSKGYARKSRVVRE